MPREEIISTERRAEILKGVHTDGGRATDSDLVQIRKFKEYLGVYGEARKRGLSQVDAGRYAGMEVYGNVNCE